MNLQENTRVWAHWIHSFDMNLSCLGPVSYFLHPESPQGAHSPAATVAAGLLAATSFSTDTAGNIVHPQPFGSALNSIIIIMQTPHSVT